MPTPQELLAALDPEQRQVAEALRGPVRVLAGAGTGKTRAITHRIAYGVATGVYAPSQVLAVTFTTRAAGEMRGRLRRLGAPGVQARTFHSAALRQLRYFWPRVHGTDPPQLVESKLSMLAAAARGQRIRADQALLKDLASEVEWAKVSNITPEAYPRLAPGRGRSVAGHDAEVVGRLLATYEEVKRAQGRMDMEDVLLLTAGLLAEDERVAASVRQQYHWFVVDEFQDVSPIQSALLDLWRGEREELCVVGDPAQTIYSFAGASASYLRDFPRRHPGTTSVELVRNYRSTPEVVAAANHVLAGSSGGGLRLRAQRASGPRVTCRAYDDEVAEADAVASRVAALLGQGVPLGQIAVLFRVNAQSDAYEAALSAAGIAYVLRGGARFFDRPEVRQAVTLLRGAARAGAPADQPLAEVVRSVLSGMGWSPEPPTQRGQVRDRWESLEALVFEASGFDGGLDELVADLDRRAAEQHAPVADGVTLATLHAAKGLEWDAVFLVGLQEGTVPISYAVGPAEVEEERRLLYVGMTRAREHLALSWAWARTPGGRGNRDPSRFLEGLAPQRGRQGPTRSARSRKASQCRECGAPLVAPAEKRLGRCAGCPASYDEELYERLRAWRLERATADGVPAFVVFTDATLQLIAEQRPRSEADLLRISGIGKSKVERYSSDVLMLLQG